VLIDEARHGRADLTGERTTPRLGLSGARHAGVPGAGLLEKLIRKTALGSFRPIERNSIRGAASATPQAWIAPDAFSLTHWCPPTLLMECAPVRGAVSCPAELYISEGWATGGIPPLARDRSSAAWLRNIRVQETSFRRSVVDDRSTVGAAENRGPAPASANPHLLVDVRTQLADPSAFASRPGQSHASCTKRRRFDSLHPYRRYR
jgi:hypothetical protein